MFLSDVDIKKALEAKSIEIRPFFESQLQVASYDVTLGNEFEVVDRHYVQAADPANREYPRTKRLEIQNDDFLVLHPGENILGKQREFISLDNQHLVLLSGKSSLARIGLVVHNTAMLFNPGHAFYPTFELVNNSNVPIILRPGMEIAQLLFARLSSPTSQDYKTIGRYDEANSAHFVPKNQKKLFDADSASN
jgi:dCTP deaminase